MVSTTMVDQGPHDMKQIHGRAGRTEGRAGLAQLSQTTVAFVRQRSSRREISRMLEGVAPTMAAGVHGGTGTIPTPADTMSLRRVSADNDEREQSTMAGTTVGTKIGATMTTVVTTPAATTTAGTTDDTTTTATGAARKAAGGTTTAQEATTTACATGGTTTGTTALSCTNEEIVKGKRRTAGTVVRELTTAAGATA